MAPRLRQGTLYVADAGPLRQGGHRLHYRLQLMFRYGFDHLRALCQVSMRNYQGLCATIADIDCAWIAPARALSGAGWRMGVDILGKRS